MLENYEGTALDNSMFEDIQTTETQGETEPNQTEGAGETVDTQTEGNPAEDQPTTVNVPGLGDVSVSDILEWKNGNMRQSDYTRKTTELARQREQNQQASELYMYLQSNPHIVEAMREAEQNPNSVAHRMAPSYESQAIRDIEYRQRALETDLKLERLHEKYGDIDEVALLNKATELHTDDLEFVYKALAYDGNTVDKAALIAQAKEELKKELMEDKATVGTSIVNTGVQSSPKTGRSLTADEKRVAQGMGLSEAEYLKWVE